MSQVDTAMLLSTCRTMSGSSLNVWSKESARLRCNHSYLSFVSGPPLKRSGACSGSAPTSGTASAIRAIANSHRPIDASLSAVAIARCVATLKVSVLSQSSPRK